VSETPPPTSSQEKKTKEIANVMITTVAEFPLEYVCLQLLMKLSMEVMSATIFSFSSQKEVEQNTHMREY